MRRLHERVDPDPTRTARAALVCADAGTYAGYPPPRRSTIDACCHRTRRRSGARRSYDPIWRMSMSRSRSVVVLSLALLLFLATLAPAAAAQTPELAGPAHSLTARPGWPPVGEWLQRLLAWLGLSRSAGDRAAGPVLVPAVHDPATPAEERFLLLPSDPQPLAPVRADAQPAATPLLPAAAQPIRRADVAAPTRLPDPTRSVGGQVAPDRRSAPSPAIRLTPPVSPPRMGPKPPSVCPDRACPDDSTGCSPCPPAPSRLPTAVR